MTSARINNKQSGFSIVEVVVASVIMSAILYVASSGLIEAFSQQSKIVNKDNANQFTASIANYFNNQTLCTDELKGQNFPVNKQRKLKVTKYKGFNDEAKEIAEGTMLTDDIMVNSLDLIHKTSVPPHTIGTGSGLSRVYVAQVKVAVSLPSKTTDSKARIDSKPSYIEFPVITNSSNVIQGCQVGLDLNSACNALGLTLDPSTQECVPESTCLVKGTYVTTSCSPSQYGCDGTYNTGNPATGGGTNCPKDSSPRLTGELVYTSTASCGKKCTVDIQNQTRFFICMQCK